MEDKQMDYLLNGAKGKECNNCQFSNGDENDEFITCGVHISNFSSGSSCDHWEIRNPAKRRSLFEKQNDALNEMGRLVKEQFGNVNECKYCGRTEICVGAAPEGCVLAIENAK